MSVFLLQISFKLAKQLLKYTKQYMHIDVSIFYTQVMRLARQLRATKDSDSQIKHKT